MGGGPLRLFLATAVAAVLVGVGGQEAALACSCVGGDTRRALEGADAVFIGSLRDRPSERGGEGVYTFAVEQSVKGGLGPRVEVVAATDGAGCGFEVAVGERAGFLLRRRPDGRFGGGLCGTVDADRLLAAAQDLPAPVGGGAPVLLVGTRYGDAEVVALDGEGRILSYGAGPASAAHLSMCPGGARVAQLRHRWEAESVPEVVIRTVPDLAVTSSVAVPDAALSTVKQRFTSAFSCRRRDGGDVFLATAEGTDESRRGTVLRLVDGRVETLWQGSADHVVLSSSRNVAYLTRRNVSATKLVEVNLLTGETTDVAEVPVSPPLYAGAFVPSGDEALLAAVVYSSPGPDNDEPSRLVLVDRRASPGERPEVRTHRLATTNRSGTVGWLDADRFVFVPSGGDAESTRVYDDHLEVKQSWDGWAGSSTAVIGPRVYLAATGAVLVHDLDSGRGSLFHDFEDVSLHALVAPSLAPTEEPPALPEGLSHRDSQLPGTSTSGESVARTEQGTGDTGIGWAFAYLGAAAALAVAAAIALRRRRQRDHPHTTSDGVRR